jgi:hypothetical protein
LFSRRVRIIRVARAVVEIDAFPRQFITYSTNALEDVQAFFASYQPSIQLNVAKSKTTALQEAREPRLQLLGSSIGPAAVRERFLEVKIAAEEALLAKPVDLRPPGPPTVCAAEPATPAAFSALRRLAAPLGTTGRVPGQFRAQDPRHSVSGTDTGLR